MRISDQFRPRRLNPAGYDTMIHHQKSPLRLPATPRFHSRGVQRGGRSQGLFFHPMKTYAEKLKDPRWQRKRLEILQRDDFTCRACGAKTETLHVHHIRYFRGRNPWDYKEFYLVTLCERCHESEEDEIKAATVKRKAKAEPSRQPYFQSVVEEVADEERASPEQIEGFFTDLKAQLAKIIAAEGGSNGW